MPLLRSRSGFTIRELMTVTIVVALMLAIFPPLMIHQKNQARQRQLDSALVDIRRAYETGRIPAEASALRAMLAGTRAPTSDLLPLGDREVVVRANGASSIEDETVGASVRQLAADRVEICLQDHGAHGCIEATGTKR